MARGGSADNVLADLDRSPQPSPFFVSDWRYYETVSWLEQPVIDRKQRWQEAEEMIESMAGVLGRTPVEPAVRSTAVALQAMGIPTYASCEGHRPGQSSYISVGLRMPAPPWVPGELSKMRKRNLRYRSQVKELLSEFLKEQPQWKGTIALGFGGSEENFVISATAAGDDALSRQHSSLIEFGAFLSESFFS